MVNHPFPPRTMPSASADRRVNAQPLVEDASRTDSVPRRCPSAVGACEIEPYFQLVRDFVAHLMATNARPESLGSNPSHGPVDWEVISGVVADCHSVEQAIGRAIVIADQMSRGVFDRTPAHVVLSPVPTEDPFFAFSVADAVPDFGDQSRYRSRVTGKVARIFATRRAVVTASDPGTSCLTDGPHRNIKPVVGQSVERPAVATEPIDGSNTAFTCTAAS